ncbi:hypothetical protein [Salinifilum ghardaiensis]
MADDDTLMWEARAAPGSCGALLRWVEETALPAARGATRLAEARLYEAGEDRVVAILHFDGAPASLPEPPRELLHREPHQWTFRCVRAR